MIENSGGGPDRHELAVRKASLLFKQARTEELRGNHELAEALRDRAEAIYQALETKGLEGRGVETEELMARVPEVENRG